jgi:hypothetical protein
MNKEIRVLILADGIGPHAGRGTDVIEEIARHQAKLGIKVILLTTIDRFTNRPLLASWQKKMSELGIVVEIVSLSWMSKWPHLSIWLSKPLTFFAALRAIIRYKVTVVHEFSSSPLLCVRTWMLGLFGNTKTIHSIITSNESAMSAPITAIFTRLVTKVIFPSQAYCKKFGRFLSINNVVILSQGVDSQRFSPETKLKKLPFKVPAKKLIVYLGTPEK